MYYVYLTTNKLNGFKYVGQHKTDCTNEDDMLNDRYFGKGARIKELIKMHGKSIFKKEILKICAKKEEAEYYELFYIDTLDAIKRHDFYNINRTSSKGLTESVNKLISDQKIELYKNNPDKMSMAMKAYYSDPMNKRKFDVANEKRYPGSKERETKRLHGSRIQLINKLKWIRNIKIKEENIQEAKDNGFNDWHSYLRSLGLGGGYPKGKPTMGYGKYSKEQFKSLVYDKIGGSLKASIILDCHKTTVLNQIKGYAIVKGVRASSHVKDAYYEALLAYHTAI